MDMGFSKYKNTKSFYISRIVRVYPCYWFAAITEFFFQQTRFNYYYLPIDSTKLRKPLAQLIQFSNVFLFGKDDIFFLSQDANKTIYWITAKEKNTLNYYSMVFPSWSMGIFMKFYLFLPIFARFQTKYLLLFFIIIFFMRAYFYSIKKMNFDPYNHRFFPFELSFFLTGQLINRFYLRYQQLYDLLDYSYLPVLFLSVFMFLYDHFFLFLGHQFLPLLITFILPYIFHISKNSIVDRKLCDLTYYMFIWQTIVTSILNKLLPKALVSGSKFLILQTLFCFIFSFLYDELIQKYINKKFKPRPVETFLSESAIKNIRKLNKEDYDIKESTHFHIIVNANKTKINRNSRSNTNSDTYSN